MSIKVGIIANNNCMCLDLAKQIDKSVRYQLCFVISKPSDYIKYIMESDPDVLIMSYEMPDRSGISILKELGLDRRSTKPYVIMALDFTNERLLRYLYSIGMRDHVVCPFNENDIMLKLDTCYSFITFESANDDLYLDSGYLPYRMHVVHDTVDHVYSERNLTMLSGICYELLIGSCFKTTTNGFAYIIEAVKIMYKRGGTDISATKELYPLISEKTMSNPGTIERSIRSAVDDAWTSVRSGKCRDDRTNMFMTFEDKPGNLVFLKHLMIYARHILECNDYTYK